MKVIVSQYGSRRRYMIPQLLHERNCLEALYTDATAESALGLLARILGKCFGKQSGLARLANRKTGLPGSLVKSNDWLQVKLLVNRILHRPVLNDVTLIFEGSSNKYKRWGVRNADWLYTMFIENCDFTQYAKAHGVKVIADIYENPYIWEELISEIEREEYKRIAHLKELYQAQATLRSKYIDCLLETADKYLVPSEYVRECLKKSRKYDDSKTNIIPYVSSVRNKEYNNNPVKGRIIWIGNDAVRKGLCYCAAASTLLKKKYDCIDFRIIGPVPEELKSDPFYKDLNFIGYCNKSELEVEFRNADMFVFPTLAEGFAAVLLEASSFGVPIITTNASGFSASAPCIFIKKHSAADIVDAVSKLIDNRQYRQKLSQHTFNYSQTIGASDFGDKLMNILAE